MDTNSSNTTAWVVGIVVVIVLAGLGLWWYSASQAPGTTQQNTNATSTSETATTTGDVPAKVSVVSRTGSTVASIVASVPNATQYNSLLANSGISLSGKGPYTVFVPTDGAFARLAPGTLSALSAAEKKRLVQYSIVSGKTLDIDATSSGNIQTLSKDYLNFTVRMPDGVAQVGSGFAITQYKASNGIVYVITTVNLPPQQAVQ